jgi:ribonuclease PH
MSASGSGGGGLVCEVRYMPHVGVRAETLARHSLSHDFSSSSGTASSGGGGATAAPRVPRDSLGTSQDSSALSSGASPCSPAAFSDETHLSRRLGEALAPAVVAPPDGGKTCVEVFVCVLQGDGCVFDAAVVGASLALADAGVPMRDVVTAGTAAVMRLDDEDDGAAATTTATVAARKAIVPRYAVIADPTEDEVLRACGVVTIALMPNWREVTAWDQFGRMPPGAAAEATELARCGCATMHKFLRNCLLTTTRNDGGGER